MDFEGIYATLINYNPGYFEVKRLGKFYYISLAEIAQLARGEIASPFDSIVIEEVYRQGETGKKMALTYGWYQYNLQKGILVEAEKPEKLTDKRDFYSMVQPPETTKIYI
jgi:hypothetical protein